MSLANFAVRCSHLSTVRSRLAPLIVSSFVRNVCTCTVSPASGISNGITTNRQNLRLRTYSFPIRSILISRFSTSTESDRLRSALEIISPIERFATDAYKDFEAQKKFTEALKIVDEVSAQQNEDKLLAASVRTRYADFLGYFDRNTTARDPKEAETQAKKALELLKELPINSGSEEVQDARMAAWLAIGNAQVGLKQFEESEDSFCEALKIAEASSDSPVRIASTLHCLAKNYEIQGGIVYAEGLYNQALAFLSDATEPKARELMKQVQVDWNGLLRHLGRAS